MNAIAPSGHIIVGDVTDFGAPMSKTVDWGMRFEDVDRNSNFKHVIREDTGESLSIVKQSFQCAPHNEYFNQIREMLATNMSAKELKGATIKTQTAKHGAWALQDFTFPGIKAKVESKSHKTEVALRAVAWHGIDGHCSNNALFGAIDFFCTNGMVLGDHVKTQRRNSKNFNLEDFVNSIESSKISFIDEVKRIQIMADTQLSINTAEKVLENIITQDGKRVKMLDLVKDEMGIRGDNVFALHSAFTNYATHRNDNGFELRETANDTQAETMHKREDEVSKWLSTEAFNSLIAA